MAIYSFYMGHSTLSHLPEGRRAGELIRSIGYLLSVPSDISPGIGDHLIQSVRVDLVESIRIGHVGI